MKSTKISQRALDKLKLSDRCCKSPELSSMNVFDKNYVAQAIKDFESGTPQRKCAEQLGIPAYCVDDFLKAGHLKLVSNPDSALLTDQLLIGTASLNSFAGALKAAPISKPSDQDLPLKVAMFGILAPQAWVRIYEAIFTRQDSCYLSYPLDQIDRGVDRQTR